MSKTIFLAGASGVIGQPLSKALIAADHTVYSTTRSQAKADMLVQIGVKSVIVDAFDADQLAAVMVEIKPQIVLHQLIDLPDGLVAGQMKAALMHI